MRTRTGRARHGITAGRACPAASNTDQRVVATTVADGLSARTTDELVAAIREQLDSPPHEVTTVVGLAGPRIVALERTDLADGEGPVLAAMQAVLQHADAAALVVFTDRRPPQWVVQPCHLFRDVAVVTNRPRPGQIVGEPL